MLVRQLILPPGILVMNNVFGLWRVEGTVETSPEGAQCTCPVHVGCLDRNPPLGTGTTHFPPTPTQAPPTSPAQVPPMAPPQPRPLSSEDSPTHPGPRPRPAHGPPRASGPARRPARLGPEVFRGSPPTRESCPKW